MRLLIKPEWSDHYVRYKLYKTLLKFKDDDCMCSKSHLSRRNVIKIAGRVSGELRFPVVILRYFHSVIGGKRGKPRQHVDGKC